MHNYIGTYGRAAQELEKGERWDNEAEEPMETEMVTVKRLREDGTVKLVRRPWNGNIDRSRLVARLTEWDREVKKYKEDCSKIWQWILKHLDQEVQQRVLSSVEFKELKNRFANENRHDSLALWILVKKSVTELGGNAADNVKEQWKQLRQRDPNTGKLTQTRC
jgi:hypothetical protein